ncbi:MAG: selenide, water dikinase SelD [Myxococcota bacterium]|nr:selenide, water dikinase SelD [Myxococcota bacterium]
MPVVDAAKRQRVMARSMKLGHCICDPKRPCPCDIFTGQGICPCAGERPDPVDLTALKLTDIVHNAGCASKIAATDLEGFLSRLPSIEDPAVISGLPAGDDAGIYRLSDDVALVQTVDVFTPCVDDPYVFGKICAANCLSDIYAMGGTPKTALSVLAFPSETLDGEIMFQMMQGAIEVLNEAGCALIGGHSIKDEEIKLGFAITGLIDPERAVSLETAAVGDTLIITKPLGTGVLSFAKQIGRIDASGLRQAEQSMLQLNKTAADAMNAVGVSACTDITGFSLFGHLVRMVRRSRVTARIFADALPAFDGALTLLNEGVIPGAIERNREFVGEDLLISEDIDEAQAYLGFDAQTSGGLLIAVPEAHREPLCNALIDNRIIPYVIGKITEPSDGKIALVKGPDDARPLQVINRESFAPLKASATPAAAQAEPAQALLESATAESPEVQPGIEPSDLTTDDDKHDPGCCADVFGEAPSQAPGPIQGSTAPVSMAAFGDLMQSAGSAGLLDEKTKELITFALVLLSRCEPCLAVHFEKARNMGITQPELDEVAWCAIAMGGAPVKMFYTSYLEKETNKEGGLQ